MPNSASAPTPEAAKEAVKPEPEDPTVPISRSQLKWRTGGSWQSTHEDYVKRAQQGKVNLVFFGDSITQWWGWQDFKKRYGPKRGVNFGIGGDKTQNLLWRIQNGEMDGITPKVAVVMIGTNNLSNSPSGKIALGITKIVEAIREKSPTTKVLLLGIFPRGWDGKQYAGKIKTINTTISALDDGKMVRYADLGRHLLEADGNLSREVSSDSLHLKSAGYVRWAEAMQPILDEMMGTQPQPITPSNAPEVPTLP